MTENSKKYLTNKISDFESQKYWQIVHWVLTVRLFNLWIFAGELISRQNVKACIMREKQIYKAVGWDCVDHEGQGVGSWAIYVPNPQAPSQIFSFVTHT